MPSSIEPASEPPATGKGGLQRWIRLGALWALAFVLLLVVAVQWLGVEESWAQLTRLGAGTAALVLALSLVNYGLRALRWQLLARAVRVELPLARNSLYYLAGFAFTVTPGKLGEVVRLWLLNRQHGYRYERTAGLLVMDRLTDAIPLFLLCLIGAGRFAGQGTTLLGLGAVVAGAALMILRPGWLLGLVKLTYARLRRAPRLFARALRALRTLETYATPATLLPALALGLAGWSAEVLGAVLVLDALGAPLGFAEVGFVFAFSMLIGSLPIFPGGVGGAEGTMIACLLLLGVGTETAIAATALIRLATLGFAMVIGFLVLPLAVVGRPAAPPAPSRSPG